MKRNFLNTKNIVIGLVSLVLIGASATGVTVFLKNRGEAEAAQEQVQNLPTTGNDNQEQNNPGTPAENPSDPEIPGTPVEPTTPGTTTPVEPTTPGSTTTRPSTGTTTPSREEISQGIEETVRIERQKVFEDLQLSWTTIGIPAITANMGIFKPELQIEKTVAAVVKAGESEQIPVTENNKPMVRAGDTVIYTIQVSNLGNYKATNVVVTDSLDVIFDGKTVPANQKLAKIETLEAGKVATLKVGYVVKQADIDAVETNEQNETISKDIINIAIATDGKTTVEDEDNMPVNPDVTINVNKNWQDNDNQDGKRPEKITVELYRNNENEPVETVTIDASSDWKYVFNNLPKYDENKNEITYKVVEVTVPEYDTEYEITDNEVEIYNHHTPEITEISGSKTWADSNNQDGKRPDSITVRLLANGKEVANKEIKASDNWAWEFEDLPVYEAGNKITYTISEDEVSGYTTTMNGYNITNSYKPETTEISGSKTWDDANNQDGKRPESIIVRLLANGKEVDHKEVTSANNWTWEFKDLPVYELGKKITYTISEDEVSGYTTTMNGYNITNSYEPEKTSISGRKTWVDLSNSTRPDSITVELFKTVDGTTTSMGDNYKRTLTGSTVDYSWSNLPVYEAGKRITYTVREVGEVNGKIDGKNGTKYEVEYDSTGLNITNTIAQELISISGSKIWIAPEGTEHPEIVIGIKQNKDVYYKDGKPYTITLPKNTQDSVDYTFTDLPRYTIENGKVTENEYEVYEVTDLADYNTRKQTLRLEDGTIKQNIVNTLKEIDAKVKFKATKNWVDEGTEATREDIKVNLYKNEDKKATATRTIAKGETPCTCTFDNLPKYDVTTDSEGYVVSITENSYYVREEKAVEGYEAPQYSSVTSNSAKTEFYQTITNTIKQSTIDIPVEKIWNTAKGIVKPTIKFTLKMNGETYNKEDGTPYTITLENGTFTGTFTNLPKYKQANGKLVLEDGKVVRNEYTVVEEELSGYTSESKYENGKYTFTNTAKGIVKVTKHSSTATTDTVPVDVVLMLDVSGSMLNNNGKDKEPQSRAENMVSAVNSAISTIMAKNQNNRVSVVAFSSTNKDNDRNSYAYTNTIVLLPLAHYPTRNEYLSYSDDDDWDWEYTNYGKDWRYTEVNSAKISVIGTNKEISVTGGTYTQTGIYEGAMQLINTSDVTYTKGEGYDTVTRIPIMMLLTDGLPTYASTTWNGKPTNKADVKDNDNNPGANTTADEAYYTIRTAKHFKGKVGEHYNNTDAKFYTIGFGVDSKDKLANAILNPTATNINNCQGYGTAGSLYNKVMSNDQKTAGQYSYADDSYIGSMDTGTLTGIMNNFINANSKVTEERIMTEEELTGKIINLDNIDIEKEFKISYETADGTKEYNFSKAKTAGLVKTDDNGAYYVDLNGVDITGQIIIAYNEKTVNS